MACLPVGEVMNVREVTGKLSEEVSLLARQSPQFLNRASIDESGESTEPMVVELFNPTSQPVEYELSISSGTRQWLATPDHVHRKVYPGQRATMPIGLRRFSNTFDETFEPPELTVKTDYMAESARISVKDQQLKVPLKIKLPAPSQPAENLAAKVDQENYFRVEDGAIGLPDGPFTLECWCKAQSFGERVGLITKTQNSEYGIFVGSGEPHFSVFLDRRYVDASSASPILEVGKWYHLAGVYDETDVRMYVDGKLVGSQAASGRRRTNGLPLIIGGDVDNGGRSTSGFDGWIDGVRLSKTARYTTDEFTPQERMTPDEHTLLLLNFDAMIGPLAYDGSGKLAHPYRVGHPTLEAAND